MHYGGDYNPEQWPEEVWPEDIRLMKQAGVTTITLGVFAWSRIQPAEGVFDWGWLDRIIDLLHEGGIQIDMATATASPPPWATTAYPDILPRTADGATLWPGSRQAYSPTSPDYRRLAAALVTAIAERYAKHPAIIMWHVNNELGCHIHADYSDNAQAAFRAWLEARYGHIDALNNAWGTDFWSQRYTSFDQIVPPRTMPYSPNPSGVLDFKRFTSDALLALYKTERDIIRAAGATQPITTNFMGAFPAADYWRWAPELDFISDDNYPDPNDPESFRGAAFTRDLMRSLKPGVPWILMEQASSAINWRPTNAPKAPGQLAALSAQAVGRGADGIMFFQWRQSRRGSEKFLTGMLPHSGTDTRVWREVSDLGQSLAALPPLPSDGKGSPVALAFDWENWWAISNSDHPVELDYLALIQRWYDALHRQHIPVDIVHPSHDLSTYSLVVAPHLYLLTDDSARNMHDFAKGGGHVLFAAFTDVVDETDAFRESGYLGSLGGTLGITLEEFGALVPPPQQSAGTSAGDTVASRSFVGPGEDHATVTTHAWSMRGQYLAEVIHAVDADVVGTFSDGRNAGLPAFTSRNVGAGRAYYLATIPDDEGMTQLTGWLTLEAGARPLITGLSEWVEVIRRGNFLFLINHGPEHVVVPVTGHELRTNRAVDSVSLAQYDWVVVDTEEK